MGETSLLVTRGGSGVPGSGPGQFQPGHQVGGAGDMSGSSPAPTDHHLQITAASPAAAASQQPLLNQSVVSPAPSQVSHLVTLPTLLLLITMKVTSTPIRKQFAYLI